MSLLLSRDFKDSLGANGESQKTPVAREGGQHAADAAVQSVRAGAHCYAVLATNSTGAGLVLTGPEDEQDRGDDHPILAPHPVADVAKGELTDDGADKGDGGEDGEGGRGCSLDRVEAPDDGDDGPDRGGTVPVGEERDPADGDGPVLGGV